MFEVNTGPMYASNVPHFSVITLLPEMFAALSDSGISGRAFARGLYHLNLVNPRDFVTDAHHTVDDRPYGGGPGMVMMAEPLQRAIIHIQTQQPAHPDANKAPVIYLSPQGQPLDHAQVERLAKYPQLTLLCGRYEGIDQRFLDRHVTEEISLGDFVLSGGELAAMALLDAIIRHIPGALNTQASAEQDSFVNGLLDCPHYTRPEKFEGIVIPEVLKSGHHAAIQRWRLKQSLGATWLKRPDLLNKRPLTPEECSLLEEFKQEHHRVHTAAMLQNDI